MDLDFGHSMFSSSFRTQGRAARYSVQELDSIRHKLADLERIMTEAGVSISEYLTQAGLADHSEMGGSTRIKEAPSSRGSMCDTTHIRRMEGPSSRGSLGDTTNSRRKDPSSRVSLGDTNHSKSTCGDVVKLYS